MPDRLFAVLVIITWVSVGLAAVAFFLGRHGRRDWHWYLLGALLGPILLPIVAEMSSPAGKLLQRSVLHPVPAAATGTPLGAPLTALLALDGSAESERVFAAAARMLPPGTHAVLLTVLDPDDAEVEEQHAASARLEQRAADLAGHGLATTTEVASGDPARVILERAEANGADVLVVGHRGRGLSHRVLGSVADQLVRSSPQPVLLGTPTPAVR